ncbi:hypothetical protein BT69DRAFT_1284380 [Atractiella rhizophila]|nr:hypothetical protein BT69DRAFT_1284380 [Atractiella rhizophila]
MLHHLISLVLLSSILNIGSQAAIIKIYDPSKAGAKVTNIGPLNGNVCPKQYPNCVGNDQTQAQTFFVSGSGSAATYNFYKGAKYDRAEVHGGKGLFEEGKTYYINWKFLMTNLPKPVDCTNQDEACTVKTNRVFQFHQFAGTSSQPAVLNIPLQWLVDGSGKNLTYYNKPNNDQYVPLFTTPAVANKWYDVTIRITTGRTAQTGITELWLDGKKKTLTNGQTVARVPTWDGGVTEPKWGAYGAWMTSITTKVGKIIVADRYADILDEKAKTEGTAAASLMAAVAQEHKSFAVADVLKGSYADAFIPKDKWYSKAASKALVASE